MAIKNVIQNGANLMIGPVQLGYCHVLEKYNPDNLPDGGKYSAAIIIPADDERAIQAVNAAVLEAAKMGMNKKWGGVKPQSIGVLRQTNAKGEEPFPGCKYFNAKSKKRPVAIDRNKQNILDPEELYSGVWAVVDVTFFPYATGGNKGVSAFLNAVMKVRDGERLGGGGSALLSADSLDLGDDGTPAQISDVPDINDLW